MGRSSIRLCTLLKWLGLLLSNFDIIKFMKGFITNIEKDTIDNNNFRKVLYTAKSSQLVLMNLEPLQDIGEEIHQLDQFFRIEEGIGRVVLDGIGHEVRDGSAIVVPAGTKHNLINTSVDKPLKLYSIYSPPNHKDGTIHQTKADAEANEEHFDGVVTEA